MSPSHHHDVLESLLAPLPRFICGAFILPAFLFLPLWWHRAIGSVLFALLALLAGKRLRWGYFLLLIFSVVFFHLLAPVGRVLYTSRWFTLTEGALVNGLKRAFTLVGMVFLSVAAVKPQLHIPGRFGGLLGQTFWYFEKIWDGKRTITRKNFFSSLDALLLERFSPELLGGNSGKDLREDMVSAKEQWKGWGLAVIFVLLAWGSAALGMTFS
ncbi:MAG: hypothetical protein MI717_13545 [Spirochaetales bacterium]|nr:hypothetical protein [Spirochaetales bacterium]